MLFLLRTLPILQVQVTAVLVMEGQHQLNFPWQQSFAFAVEAFCFAHLRQILQHTALSAERHPIAAGSYFGEPVLLRHFAVAKATVQSATEMWLWVVAEVEVAIAVDLGVFVVLRRLYVELTLALASVSFDNVELVKKVGI